MRVRVLGSGTLLPDALRGAPGFWVRVGEARVLMDCGSGSLRTLARLGLPWRETTHLALTHFHTDHLADLAPLLFALKHGCSPPREDPLILLGPPGLGERLGALERAYGAYVRDPGFPLYPVELAGGEEWQDQGGSFRLGAYRTGHTQASLAYRLRGPGGDVGFTGDTGPDRELGGFMEGVALLVAECSHPDGVEAGLHLSPASLAELAARARPNLLVTVHAYPPLDPDAVPHLLRSEGYSGEARAGSDGMTIELVPGQVVRVEEAPP